MDIKKSITLTADTKIDGNVVMRHTATINSENPEDISISHPVLRKNEYRDNRTTVMADYMAFEDAAFQVQQELLKTAGGAAGTTFTE